MRLASAVGGDMVRTIDRRRRGLGRGISGCLPPVITGAGGGFAAYWLFATAGVPVPWSMVAACGLAACLVVEILRRLAFPSQSRRE